MIRIPGSIDQIIADYKIQLSKEKDSKKIASASNVHSDKDFLPTKNSQNSYHQDGKNNFSELLDEEIEKIRSR